MEDLKGYRFDCASLLPSFLFFLGRLLLLSLFATSWEPGKLEESGRERRFSVFVNVLQVWVSFHHYFSLFIHFLLAKECCRGLTLMYRREIMIMRESRSLIRGETSFLFLVCVCASFVCR